MSLTQTVTDRVGEEHMPTATQEGRGDFKRWFEKLQLKKKKTHMRIHAQNTETSHALNSHTPLTSQRGADVFAVITAESKQPTGFGAQAGCWVVTRF